MLQKYDALFERNAKNGSFYLQSKVHKAKECLEAFYRDKGQGNPSWKLSEGLFAYSVPCSLDFVFNILVVLELVFELYHGHSWRNCINHKMNHFANLMDKLSLDLDD